MKCKTCNGLGRIKATEFVGVDEGLREVVILCPTCGGTGKVVHPMMSMNGDEYTGEREQHECEACNGTGVVEPLTNEEYIRSCNTSELAKLIYKIVVTDVLMDRFFTAEVVNAWIVDVDSGVKEAEKWLKENHYE